MSAELLAAWQELVRLGPDEPAWWIRHPDGSRTELSRRGVQAEVDGLAAAVGAGGPVVATVAADTGMAQVCGILACWSVGALPAVVDPATASWEADRLLHGSAERAVAWDGPFGSVRVGVSTRPAPAGPAWLAVSGGSTGRPKLLPSTVSASARRLAGDRLVVARLGWRAGQRQLVLCRPSHTAFTYHAVLGLLDGNVTGELMRFDPSAAVAAVRELGAEWLLLTPHHLGRLAPALRDPSWATTLRSVVHTGAPCPAPTKAAWIEALGPTRVHELYGATEGCGITLIRGDEWLAHPGSVGRGFLTDVRVVDEAGAVLGPGTVGRVQLRSGRARAFTGVGDLGRLDEDGYLYLVGREQDAFERGGAMVYPRQVEDLLAGHPDVADAVAFALPSRRLGHRLVAAVVLLDGAPTSSADLHRFCRRHLSREQVPSRVVIVAELPRSSSGKVAYGDLRRLVGATDG